MQSILTVILLNFQVETSSVSGGHTITEAASAESLNIKPDEASVGDSNEKEMTLGDALSQAKDASLTSLEEIQNLAGGADIKVNLLFSFLVLYRIHYSVSLL